MYSLVQELIKYKWLLQELIIRDLKLKYRRSFLGYLWSVLNPLMMMAVITIVFSNMFRFDIPNYPVYLLAGHLIYGFYAEATTMAMGAVVGGAALIKKVYLPKYIFPLSRVLSCFATMIFSMLALFIVMFVEGINFRATLILMPIVLIYVLLFCIGMGLMLSVVTVFFRDILDLYGVVLTALNYLTPIFYPVNLLPAWLRELMVYNPLYAFITFFRKIAVYGQWPTLEEHIHCAIFAVVMLAIGMYVFKNNQDDFILYI